MRKLSRHARLFRGLTALLCVLLSIAIYLSMVCFEWSGNINAALKVEVPTVAGDGDSTYYPTAYTDDGVPSAEGLTKMLEASDAHDVQTMEEGAVLLKNNSALPLAGSERSVTLFGRAVADPVYRCNSGGADPTGDRLVTLYGALKAEGFDINDELFNAYANSKVTRQCYAVEDANGRKSDIGELPGSFYTQSLQNSYSSKYNDVAIVMFSREGGEGKDLFTEDAEGISQLALHQAEKDLLLMIKGSGKFNKIIVLINSPYAMELDWLYASEYGVDAALWIGCPGLKGFTGVANILVGKADPSGRTVDTYAANSLSAPAVRNSGDFGFTGSDYNYIVEAEGIYVGYKYYETRYQDQVLGINNATGSAGVYASAGNSWNYADEMTYTFGYGTSYADFTQTLVSVEWDRVEHTVTAVVNVKNNGDSNGVYTGKSKSVVELYVQLPYESGMAEKSAIQLIGYEKTKLLSAGEEDTVTITVDDYLFATYDENAVNGADNTKLGCYVFDEGNYYFAIGDDAHDALNNVLAEKEGENVSGKLTDAFGRIVDGDTEKVRVFNVEECDNVSYARSQYTGEIVSNHFEDIDINYFIEDAVTYLTRDDWNTYPKAVTGLSLTTEMLSQINAEYSSPSDAPAYSSFTQGEDNGISFIEMKDVDYDDDETWNKFLNQLTITEMCDMVGENFMQKAITSINKPANKNTDGPSGSQNAYLSVYGGGNATCHVGQIVAASTWNKQVLEDRGSFIAEDAIYSGTSQLWSPGANLHRTPFSGRNFEYYSEDSIMSYICSAVQCSAMQEKGLCAAIKHFCANDQETNRGGLAIFMTEQSYRQGPLKGFEGAFTVGGALGTMMSGSRIGCRAMYESKATITTVMRGEWGFKGMTITDAVKGSTTFKTVLSFMSGSDIFNNGVDQAGALKTYIVSNKDGAVLQQLRTSMKRYFYTYLNSNLVNGLTPDSEVSDFVPWWQTALIVIDSCIGVCAAAGLVMYILSAYVFNKKEEQDI